MNFSSYDRALNLFEYISLVLPKKLVDMITRDDCDVQVYLPKDGKSCRSLVIHLASTGDHSYIRREWGMVDGLLKEGIASVSHTYPTEYGRLEL